MTIKQFIEQLKRDVKLLGKSLDDELTFAFHTKNEFSVPADYNGVSDYGNCVCLEVNENEVAVVDPLTPIDTPFGRIYIDKWGDGVDRECKDRITIYDSNKDWLDYFGLDYFYINSYPDSSVVRVTKEAERKALQEYLSLIEMLQVGAEAETCEGFMEWLGVNYKYVGTDKVQALQALLGDDAENADPNELETNEWVNHIGDNYVVVSEYGF